MDRQVKSCFETDKRPLAGRTLCLEGISPDTMQQHFKLYESYVDRLNEIRAEIRSLDLETISPVYGAYRNLKRAEAIAVNSVKLHELYFEQLGGAGGQPTGTIRKLIERDFGSLANWQTEFTACAKAAGDGCY